jgi:hypothetical protein
MIPHLCIARCGWNKMTTWCWELSLLVAIILHFQVNSVFNGKSKMLRKSLQHLCSSAEIEGALHNIGLPVTVSSLSLPPCCFLVPSVPVHTQLLYCSRLDLLIWCWMISWDCTIISWKYECTVPLERLGVACQHGDQFGPESCRYTWFKSGLVYKAGSCI